MLIARPGYIMASIPQNPTIIKICSGNQERISAIQIFGFLQPLPTNSGLNFGVLHKIEVSPLSREPRQAAFACQQFLHCALLNGFFLGNLFFKRSYQRINIRKCISDSFLFLNIWIGNHKSRYFFFIKILYTTARSHADILLIHRIRREQVIKEVFRKSVLIFLNCEPAVMDTAINVQNIWSSKTHRV